MPTKPQSLLLHNTQVLPTACFLLLREWEDRRCLLQVATPKVLQSSLCLACAPELLIYRGERYAGLA